MRFVSDKQLAEILAIIEVTAALGREEHEKYLDKLIADQEVKMYAAITETFNKGFEVFETTIGAHLIKQKKRMELLQKLLDTDALDAFATLEELHGGEEGC